MGESARLFRTPRTSPSPLRFPLRAELLESEVCSLNKQRLPFHSVTGEARASKLRLMGHPAGFEIESTSSGPPGRKCAKTETAVRSEFPTKSAGNPVTRNFTTTSCGEHNPGRPPAVNSGDGRNRAARARQTRILLAERRGSDIKGENATQICKTICATTA